MRREGGYTLLEMLVALAIVAMIGAALAQSTTLVSRFWTASRTAEAETEADILRVRLRQWLTTAKPPSELSGVKAPMRGDERRFSFVTTSRLAILARDEEAEIEISVGDDGAFVAIRARGADGATGHEEERRLTEVPVGLRYYDGEARRWRREWRFDDRAPELVAIEPLARNRFDWPPLIVALKVGRRL